MVMKVFGELILEEVMSEGKRREPAYLYYKEICEQNKRLEEKLDELIRVTSKLVDIVQESTPERKMVYGIEGLEELLCCSKSTANRIKATHILDPAISQINRTIISIKTCFILIYVFIKL